MNSNNTKNIFNWLWKGDNKKDAITIGILMGIQFILALLAMILALTVPDGSSCWPSTLMMILSTPISFAMLSNLRWNTGKVYNAPLCHWLFFAATSYNCFVIPFGAAFNMGYSWALVDAGRATMTGLMVVEMVMSFVWVYPLVLLKKKGI